MLTSLPPFLFSDKKGGPPEGVDDTVELYFNLKGL